MSHCKGNRPKLEIAKVNYSHKTTIILWQTHLFIHENYNYYIRGR